MKKLHTIVLGIALSSSLYSANISVDNPNGYDGNVTSQSFHEEAGNYSVSDFNADSGSILINFDDSKYTMGDSITSVIFDSGNGPFNFRANLDLLGGGYGRIVQDGSQFVSSPSQSLVWANGTGASILFPEYISGSILSESVYSVGFTLARLEIPVSVRFYSDIAGNVQLGDTISMTANSATTGYSFVGYTGTEAIRRVEIDTSGSGNSFAIDDLVVSTTSSPIPELSHSSMYLACIALWIVPFRARRRR
tara:strand:+ start:17611 stop:18360 length:750 start_codon:yes stop_codon:yes gene_type:complete